MVDQAERSLPLPDDQRLATISAFATALPRFLNAAHTTSDWVALLGTDDAKAYDTFLDSSLEWSGPQSAGFTQPPATPSRAPLGGAIGIVDPQSAEVRACLGCACRRVSEPGR